MALGKKACQRVAAMLVSEFNTATYALGFVNRITKVADTNNTSFRKTMKRIAKTLKQKRLSVTKPARKAA